MMATNTRQLSTHAGLIAILLVLALWMPLPLYLVSLALFGLPHIVLELSFLRSRYAARWPTRWWIALGIVLLLQALGRAAAWHGEFSVESSRIVDVLALFLLALLILLAPMRVGWPARVTGLLGAGAVMWLLERGDLVEALLLLAIAHNFTPLALAWDMAREHRPARGMAWMITGMLMLPPLVALSAWGGGIVPAAFAGQSWSLAGQLPSNIDGARGEAVLSAIVLAQCLHYYCVIVLLPRAEARRVGKAITPAPLLFALLVAVLLHLAYYLHDFSSARQLYAVAAGFHAWLEWPVLLMALLCMGPSMQQPGGGTARAMDA
ncbi:MAG: hypothetical protein V4857_30695 [Pseudomonadota bacterium]